MNIFKTLLNVLKVVLPFLRTAAEKAFKQLPKEQQELAINISKMVEIIKQMLGQPRTIVYKKITELTGFDEHQIIKCMATYSYQNGLRPGPSGDYLAAIANEKELKIDSGCNSLWCGMSNIVTSVVAGIDWQILLMGVGEYIYRTFVKGRVKI